MEKLRAIVEVTAVPPATLELRWSDGTRGTINLSGVLARKAFTLLNKNKRFGEARLGDWGHSVVWPGEIELGADSLWRLTLLANGRDDTVAFMDWRLQHGLTLDGAAQALGISRRMVAYYASGSHPVPRTVLLACKGWEAETTTG